MKKFFHQLFTGADNKTADLGRVLWALSMLAFISATFLAIFQHNQTLDYTAWATGAGIILAAGGGALWAKAKTEPPHEGE